MKPRHLFPVFILLVTQACSPNGKERKPQPTSADFGPLVTSVAATAEPSVENLAVGTVQLEPGGLIDSEAFGGAPILYENKSTNKLAVDFDLVQRFQMLFPSEYQGLQVIFQEGGDKVIFDVSEDLDRPTLTVPVSGDDLTTQTSGNFVFGLCLASAQPAEGCVDITVAAIQALKTGQSYQEYLSYLTVFEGRVTPVSSQLYDELIAIAGGIPVEVFDLEGNQQ